MNAPLPPVSVLYERHRRRALAIARSILRNHHDAEDVVQDVFSKLCLRPVPFDGHASVSTWLHRVMVNSSINSLRAMGRRGTLDTEPSGLEGPEESALARERHQLFLRALAELSEQHRQVLTLRELRGMSYPEIARMLHVPEGTVKSSLNRGRRLLMKVMERQARLQPTFNLAVEPG